MMQSGSRASQASTAQRRPSVVNDQTLMALYMEAFKTFDKNRDSRISAKELGAVMQSLGETPTKKELKEMIRSVDGNRSGKIDFDEFVRMMDSRASQRMGEAELKQLFCAIDRNGDDRLTIDDLRLTMKNLGEEISESELNKMMKQADTNRDGFIDFLEFRRLMQALGM